MKTKVWRITGLVMAMLGAMTLVQAEQGDGEGRPKDGKKGKRGRPSHEEMLQKFDKDGDGELSEAERTAMREQMAERRGGQGGPGGGWGFVPAPTANEYPIAAVGLNEGTTEFNWNSEILNNMVEARLHITPPYKEILDRLETLERTFGIDNNLTTTGAESSATAGYPANAAQLRGVNIISTGPTTGASLVYSVAQNSWIPSTT